ncbi:11101_t:CDS:1, partial [Ambispora leptoticha]
MQWDQLVVEDRQMLEGCSIMLIDMIIEQAMASQYVAEESVPQEEKSGAKKEPAVIMSKVEFKKK